MALWRQIAGLDNDVNTLKCDDDGCYLDDTREILGQYRPVAGGEFGDVVSYPGAGTFPPTTGGEFTVTAFPYDRIDPAPGTVVTLQQTNVLEIPASATDDGGAPGLHGSRSNSTLSASNNHDGVYHSSFSLLMP